MIKTPTENEMPIRPSFAAMWIRSLTRVELQSMIDNVKAGDADAIRQATDFVAAESFGLWHNRARAKLCRYFKNHPPSERARDKMVDAIISRLSDGRFSEQFKDQLAMAIRFDPKRLREAAIVAATSDKEYIRRYAKWVHHILDSSTQQNK